MAPLLALLVLGAIAAGIFLLSTRPARVRVIGPSSEESFLLPKGRALRIGGDVRVEGDLVYADATLPETIAQVTSTGFGKAIISPNSSLREGTVEMETDEGQTVLESGETLLTSATVTWTSPRGRKEVYSLVKEDSSTSARGGGAESGHFAGGSSPSAGTDSSDSGDWRS